mgnify:CR=1 FL=1
MTPIDPKVYALLSEDYKKQQATARKPYTQPPRRSSILNDF